MRRSYPFRGRTALHPGKAFLYCADGQIALLRSHENGTRENIWVRGKTHALRPKYVSRRLDGGEHGMLRETRLEVCENDE